MTTAWDEILEKSNHELALFLAREHTEQEKEDVDFVTQLLALSVKTGNKKVELTEYDFISPESLSFFINRYFFIKYSKALKQFLQSTSATPFQWVTEAQTFAKSPELYNYYRLWAPRWNVFARICTMTLTVKSRITIDFTDVATKSDSYTVVLYRGQHQETVASFGSREGGATKEIELSPGHYFIAYRFYSDDGGLHCPKVVIDGERTVEPAYFPPSDFEAAADRIKTSRSPAYLWQQYYVFSLMKNRRPELADVLHHELMPVPNPDTSYDFGWLPRGTALRLTLSETCLASYRVYVLYLNEQSIPVDWEQVLATENIGLTMVEDGAYFIRFVPRGVVDEAFPQPDCQCDVVQRSDGPRAA